MGPRLALPLLLAAVLPAAYVAASWRAHHTWGLPLDDSWIHAQYAHNLAQRGELSINPGDPTPGATSPIWVALIAAAARVGAPVVPAAQGLSIVFNLLSIAAAYQLARLYVSRRAAWAAALFCGASGILAWSAGGALEVGLFNFLALHAIRVHVLNRGDRWLPAAAGASLMGLATWARPEALGLAVVLAASALWAACVGGHWRRDLPRALLVTTAQAALVAVVAAPYGWFSWVTTGRPLPTTFYVKAGAPASLALAAQCLLHAARTFAQDAPAVAVAAAGGLAVAAARLVARPRQAALAAWVVGLPVAYGLIGNTEAGANFGRHFYILVPGVMVLAALALRLLAHEAELRFRRGRLLWRVALALLAADLLWHAYGRGRLYVQNVKNVTDMQVAAAHWVREHVPPRRTVAVNDVGAMAFHGSHPLVDLRGIATPGVMPYLERYGRPDEPTRDSGALEFLKVVRPDYLAVFPEWYPRTLEGLVAAGIVERVKTFALSDNVTCGSDTLVIVRLHWSGRVR